LAMSLTTPRLFSEVADGVTCNGLGDCEVPPFAVPTSV
jgi:hypothetical protein